MDLFAYPNRREYVYQVLHGMEIFVSLLLMEPAQPTTDLPETLVSARQL